jgi:hypothetical protein
LAWTAAFAVLAVAALIGTTGGVGGAMAAGIPATAEASQNFTASSATTVDSLLTVDKSVVVGSAGPEFWGVDMAPTERMNSQRTSEIEESGLDYVMWPSAKLNDHYDIINNRIYDTNGHVRKGLTDAQQFISWCKSIGCHAIIAIPGEINSPSFASEEVKYITKTLGFTPAYWEIGNEPGLWTHYNLPWSKWKTDDHSTPTAMEYAQLVNAYDKAILKADPKANIIGLPGTGLGDYEEKDWVYDTVLLNGPNLSAVAIHVYPAGHITGRQASLERFDHSLLNADSFDVVVPEDKNAIAAACPKCHIGILVTEYNAATVGAIGDKGSYAKFMEGFDEVPYLASEVIGGLTQGIVDMDLYDLQGGFPGALFGGNGPRPAAYLYSDIFPHLDTTAVATTFTGALGEFFGIVCLGSDGAMTLLIANANPSLNVHLVLTGSNFPTDHTGEIWTYTSGMSAPHEKKDSGSIPTSLTVPAESVILISVA